MINLRVQFAGEKYIRVSGIDPVLMDSLFSLPEILADIDRPDVRSRLLPAPTTDEPEINDDWQQHVVPELRHLFVTAAETVTRDLTRLDADPTGEPLRQLLIPTEHLNAWLSALNQARLILGQLHEVTETDMDNHDFDLTDPRSLALFRIHVLGYLLQYLVELNDDHGTETPL